MNIYMIIGILITVLGNFLILILGNRKNFIVYSIIINALGLGFLTVSPIISANKDKKEIIDKISEVRKEIGVIKTATKNKDSLGKIEKVENEFNEWADSFVRNLEGKKVEQKKAYVLLAEREIKLSNKWRYVYQYIFETIENMVEAYNKRAENKIEINIPSLPYNLFSKEAEAFKGTINFNNNTLWTIRLLISKPYEEEKIPTILINIITGKELVDSVRKRSESLLRLPSDLMLSINIYNKTINSIKTGSNKYFGKLDEQYSINADNYKKSIKDIFTTLFEYQLIESENQ